MSTSGVISINSILYLLVRGCDCMLKGWFGDQFMAPIDAWRDMGIHRNVVYLYRSVQQHLADDSCGSCVRWNGRDALHNALLLAGPLPDTHNGHPGGCGYKSVSYHWSAYLGYVGLMCSFVIYSVQSTIFKSFTDSVREDEIRQHYPGSSSVAKDQRTS